ncbi:MAG: PP2C family serine/threonine-protein phosphatase [Pseudonocardiales bacterium]
MALILRFAVRSDLGLVRSNNEDSVYAGPRLLAIADGMGGHAAGEVASKIVISTLENLDEDRHVGDLMSTLRDTVLDANRRIAAAVRQNSELEGMGTTLTALRFSGTQVGLVHVGDSRGYVMRGEQLSQITHDDTYVQHLVDAGKLTPDEAKDHPRKSVILRALLGSDVEPDVSIREARAGDRYLLCTDGLSDVVTAETILETLRIPDLQECADRLVELALRGGGPDNVTVIVADVVTARTGETNDDLPVLDGAFADPGAAEVPGADSAAERAARMSRRPAGPEATPEKASRRRRPWRTALIVAGILAVLIAGLGIGYRVTQAYYFIGRDGNEVAIFRGVNTQFGPLKFFNVYKNTDLKVKDLQPAVRSQVQDGIAAHNEPDAEQIVTRLHDQLLPICRRELPTPTKSRTPPASRTATGAKAPTRARTTAKPGTRTTPRTSPTPAVTSSIPSTPTPGTSIPSPDVNCRAA